MSEEPQAVRMPSGKPPKVEQGESLFAVHIYKKETPGVYQRPMLGKGERLYLVAEDNERYAATLAAKVALSEGFISTREPYSLTVFKVDGEMLSYNATLSVDIY